MQLSGRTVVLTGASGGIGKPLLEQLLDKKSRVIVLGRAMTSGDLVEGVVWIECDLTNKDSLIAAANRVVAYAPDVLINLAGQQYFGRFEQQDDEALAQLLQVNLLAPMLLSKKLIAGMLERQSGMVVNVGSIFGSLHFPHYVAYSSSKSGLRGFSESLRRELKGLGVDVAYIAPRAVKTAMNSAQAYAALKNTKSTIDDPNQVAAKIIAVIENNQARRFLGFPERLFVKLNELFPRLIDNALHKQTQVERKLFK